MNKILSIIFFLLLMLLSSGCDRDILVVRYELGQPPDRIIYIANVDTELDFTGATLVPISRNGDTNNERLLTDLLQGRQFPGWSTEIRHAIDFTTPGVYEVEILNTHPRHSSYLSFFIQVIDEATFKQLMAGDIDHSIEQND